MEEEYAKKVFNILDNSKIKVWEIEDHPKVALLYGILEAISKGKTPAQSTFVMDLVLEIIRDDEVQLDCHFLLELGKLAPGIFEETSTDVGLKAKPEAGSFAQRATESKSR